MAPTSTAATFGSLPTATTHRVEGRVTFKYARREVDLIKSIARPDFPYRYDSKVAPVGELPVRHAKIILEDPDGHRIEKQLNGNGEYCFLWNPVKTGYAKLTVYASFRSANRAATVASWKHHAITSPDDFTGDSDDYEIHTHESHFLVEDAAVTGGLQHDFFVPETASYAPAFFMMDQAQIALNYFYDIPGVHKLPKINIVYTPTLASFPGGETAFYKSSIHPGFIYISQQFRWNGFAVRHEASHMFQHLYMRNDNYGRIGEPLANVHAAAMVPGTGLIDANTYYEDMDVQPHWIGWAFALRDGAGNYWEYRDGGDWAIYDDNDEIVTNENGTVRPSSGWVQRILWDLVDGRVEPVTKYLGYDYSLKDVGQFDLIHGGRTVENVQNGGDHLLNRVLVDYLGGGEYGIKHPGYVDRGFDRVDIVDVMDGMILAGYVKPGQVGFLVDGAMDFEYEFE